jgi:hypothetical protein
MRFSCKSCQATFQTATGAPAAAGFRCPSCNGEMAVVAEVVDLYQDRSPTRRYDLDDLRARLDLEREEFAKSRGAPRSADQVWFAAVQGRQVGPLSVAGIAGLRARGQLSAASLVWREGWPSWVAAEAVPERRQILGLPEEQLGRPFPVQPAEPAPPPFESTYAAARSQPPGEPLVERPSENSGLRAPVGVAVERPRPAPPIDPAPVPGDLTDPDARVPAQLLQSFADLDRATASGADLRDPSPRLPFDRDTLRTPAPPGLQDRGAPPAPALSPVPPLPALVETTPIAPVAPPSVPPALEPSAPPAIPLAENAALESAASAVFAKAKSLADPHDEITDSGNAVPSRKPALAGAPRGVLKAAEAQVETGAPLPMIDLSGDAPAATDELPSPRRSRGPSQQQWFSAPDEKPENESRGRVLIIVAVALALGIAVMLLRTH